MRLLIVSGIFHPEVGGPATYLHTLATSLTAQQHDVAVLTYGVPDQPGIYPFRVWRVSRSGSAAARLWRFTRTLLRVSKDYPLWYVNDYGIPAMIAGAVRRPRMVMKVVGDFAWEYGRRNYLTPDGIDDFQVKRHGWRLELLKRIQRAYARRAARIIVPSVYLAGLVRGWGVDESRIVVIRNVANWAGQDAESEPTAREPLTLFTAARLAPWKGMDHLLRAFVVVRERVPFVRLVIAGDGPERRRLRRMADELDVSPAVTWLGDVDRAVVRRWMRTSTLFVLMSEYEGLSHVLLEAVAEQLPIVASAAGGNSELITDGITGAIVTPTDHTTTGNRIAELLQDPVQRAALATRALTSMTHHNWDQLVADTCAVFDSASRRP